MSEWQPIETAPKDGTIIIAKGYYHATSVTEDMLAAAAQYRNNNWWRDNNGGGFTASCYPTHWIEYPKGE